MAIRNVAAAMQFIDYQGLAVDKYFKFNPKELYHGMDLDYCMHFTKNAHSELSFDLAVLFVEFKRGEACKNACRRTNYIRRYCGLYRSV